MTRDNFAVLSDNRNSCDISVSLNAGTGWDEVTDDNVLLKTDEWIHLTLNSSVCKNTSCLLEGCSGKEGVCRQGSLCDTEELSLTCCRCLALSLCLLVLSFEIEDLAENLKKEPWVTEIAGKGSMITLPTEDIDLIVNDFICEHWMMRPEEVTTKHVADVLKVADPLSHRHLVGQKVAIDCIHALDKEQLQRLDCVLRDLEMNPNLGQSKGVGR